MDDFNTLFPNFLSLCLSLKDILTPIAYVLITSGLIATIASGHHNGNVHFHGLGKILVLLMLLVYLPTWGNQIASAVDDLVKNTLKVDPAQIHDQYEAALQLKKSASGDQSWWEKVFHFPSIAEALLTVIFMILGWIASAIEWWAYLLQSAILFIGYALAPIFIGMLAFPSLAQIGRNYLLNLLGIIVWPLGWGVAGLVTQGVLGFMTDRSFLSSPSSTGFDYSLQNLMGLAFLGIWIIFSTIAAPVVIQRAITTGSSAASSLFSGAFAAGQAAGKAGMMSLADSVGGTAAGGAGGNKKGDAAAIKSAISSGVSAGALAGMTAFETLVTASINEGHGGNSLIGSLSRMSNREPANGSSGDGSGNESNQKTARGGFPQNDPTGDKTVDDMIRKTRNPDV